MLLKGTGFIISEIQIYIYIYIIKKIIRNKDEQRYTNISSEIQKLSKNIPILRNLIN